MCFLRFSLFFALFLTFLRFLKIFISRSSSQFFTIFPLDSRKKACYTVNTYQTGRELKGDIGNEKNRMYEKLLYVPLRHLVCHTYEHAP